MAAPISQSTNEQQTTPVNQLPGWVLLALILSSADENMDLWENGQLVGHLDGTREEWLERIQALRDAEDNPQ